MLCPCGSSLSFNACCQAFITSKESQKQSPRTPEQLMRSRFSAYAMKEAQYIFDTYATKQRIHQSVVDIQSWANECSWIALVIHNANTDSITDPITGSIKDSGTVEFSAYFIVDNTLCELRENSSFTLEDGNWYYVDGDISVNKQLASVKRNDICPCNHYPTAWSAKKGKKFKNCCANNTTFTAQQ